jgi:hypothetical protein
LSLNEEACSGLREALDATQSFSQAPHKRKLVFNLCSRNSTRNCYKRFLYHLDNSSKKRRLVSTFHSTTSIEKLPLKVAQSLAIDLLMSFTTTFRPQSSDQLNQPALKLVHVS